MSATARLLEQRSIGEAALRVDADGVRSLRESGSAKIRALEGGSQAILINTSGGLAGGDRFDWRLEAGQGSRLSATSQAAERVYRTLGPPAAVSVKLGVERNAALFWLPQETILFDGSSLTRSFDVKLEEGARFLAVEPIVFGRLEMGETVRTLNLLDTWRIWRGSKLQHAESLAFAPELPILNAALAGAGAMGTIVYFADDAEERVDAVRGALGPSSGASAWNGKLIARLLAEDGFFLRKQIISALAALAGAGTLPKIWTM
jgi:urease accessory protein